MFVFLSLKGYSLLIRILLSFKNVSLKFEFVCLIFHKIMIKNNDKILESFEKNILF